MATAELETDDVVDNTADTTPAADVPDGSCTVPYIEILPMDRACDEDDDDSTDCKPEFIPPVFVIEQADFDDVTRATADERCDSKFANFSLSVSVP